MIIIEQIRQMRPEFITRFDVDWFLGLFDLIPTRFSVDLRRPIENVVDIKSRSEKLIDVDSISIYEPGIR